MRCEFYAVRWLFSLILDYYIILFASGSHAYHIYVVYTCCFRIWSVTMNSNLMVSVNGAKARKSPLCQAISNDPFFPGSLKSNNDFAWRYDIIVMRKRNVKMWKWTRKICAATCKLRAKNRLKKFFIWVKSLSVTEAKYKLSFHFHSNEASAIKE